MNIILFDSLPQNCRITDSDNGEIYRHITGVLKLGEGSVFSMGIVNSSEGTAVIRRLGEGYIDFEYTPQKKPFLFPVTLIVSQVRPICMKRILREAVSLGVEKLVLYSADTGEKSYLSSNLYKTDEYLWYLKEGAMQSAHAGIPSVVFAGNPGDAVKLCCIEDETSLYLSDNVCGAKALSGCTPSRRSVLAVGPERGWSDRERKAFIDSGFEPVLLGSRVLRTETACSAGLAVLLSRMGLL